jgi:hypothetical protein
MGTKRKNLSKKTRFEIFKRDKFTCQYCGANAPDVILHVDHIKPVARGGKNDHLNLITSCLSCNAGKSDVPLSDNTSVEKARKQADMLAERREQIEMLRDWHIGLADQSCAEVEAVNSLYSTLTANKYVIADHYKPTVQKIIGKFGLNMVLEALRSGAESYKDATKALEKLGGICACMCDPSIRRKGWIKGIARRRIIRLKEWEFNDLMNAGYRAGGDAFLDELEAAILVADGTWYRNRPHMEELVAKYEETF